MRTYIQSLLLVGALGFSASASDSAAQDLTADIPHCTVTAYPPSGTVGKVVFGGSFQCDRAVPRFRLMVAVNSHYTNNGFDDWSDGNGGALQDFTDGEVSGYTQFDGPVTPPIEMRTHVWGFIMNDDGDNVIARIPETFSGTVEFH